MRISETCSCGASFKGDVTSCERWRFLHPCPHGNGSKWKVVKCPTITSGDIMTVEYISTFEKTT